MSAPAIVALLVALAILYGAYRLGRWRERRVTWKRPPTDRQREYLAALAERAGVPAPEPANRAEASALIDAMKRGENRVT